MIKVRNLVNKYNNLSVQIKATIWFMICSFLQKGISILTTPIFTRLLDTAEYGKYNVFNSWYGIAQIIISLNLSYGVYTQGLIKFDKEREKFSSSLQGLTTCLIILWSLIYWVYNGLFNDLCSLNTYQMLLMILMVWTTSVFNFWASEQRVLYKYRGLVLLTVLVSIAKPVISIFFIKCFEDKVTARLLGIVGVEFLAYLGLFIGQIRRGKKIFIWKFWRYAILYNLPLIPHYFAQTILSSADRIMIEQLIGDSEAGIYGLAYQISLLMTLFNTALMQTINPWMFQKIKDKSEEDIPKIGYLTLIFVGAVNLLLICFAPEAVSFFAPESFAQAIWCIPPIAMSVFFMFGYELFAKFAFYYEKTKFVMIATIGAALLNLILNYVFIPIFGYIAAAYTTLICYIVYFISHYIFMDKVCRENDMIKSPYRFSVILIISIVFIAVGTFVGILYFNSILRYLFIVLILAYIFMMRKRILLETKKIMNLRNLK